MKQVILSSFYLLFTFKNIILVIAYPRSCLCTVVLLSSIKLQCNGKKFRQKCFFLYRKLNLKEIQFGGEKCTLVFLSNKKFYLYLQKNWFFAYPIYLTKICLIGLKSSFIAFIENIFRIFIYMNMYLKGCNKYFFLYCFILCYWDVLLITWCLIVLKIMIMDNYIMIKIISMSINCTSFFQELILRAICYGRMDNTFYFVYFNCFFIRAISSLLYCWKGFYLFCFGTRHSL